MDFSLFLDFFLAVSIGALIGIERTLPHVDVDKNLDRSQLGGARSYMILALL